MWIAERRFSVDFDAWDYLARAEELTVPVLVLHGGRDDFVRRWMIDSLVKELPANRFELFLYEDGYHWLLRDLKPGKVQAKILQWMAARRERGREHDKARAEPFPPPGSGRD